MGSKSGTASPRSTFSTNDLNPKTTGKQSIEQFQLGLRGAYHRNPLSPNTSFTETEQRSISSQGDSSSVPQHSANETTMLLGSTITTASSTIGLPSKYPGSAGHNRINSLESSVLLEELQDFDDIFGQGQHSSSNNSLNQNKDENDHARDYFVSRSQSDYNDDDDDDDLIVLTQSLPTKLHLHHRRNISELSTSSHNNIPASLLTTTPTEKSRVAASAGSICSNSSNHRSSASTRSTSSGMSHRRSRNRAMSSTDFHAVLDEL